MKSFEEIKKIPRFRFFSPKEGNGIGRGKLTSSKHVYLARVVLSWHSGMDVVSLMFPQHKRPTEDEIDEALSLFFTNDEAKECIIMQHPENELIAVIYRAQGGV